jgi:hypothetical protein
LLGCATTTTILTEGGIKQEKYLGTLSLSAYERAVPRLKKLRPGDSVDGDSFAGTYYKVGKAGRVAEIDGWVAPLSGNYFGGLFGFGGIIGRTEDSIIGQHVFGYVIGGATLVPKYVVNNQATILSQKEFKPGNKGQWWVALAVPPLEITPYKDVIVKEVRELDFPDLKRFEIGGNVGNLDDVIRIHTTRERFAVAENRLKSLVHGTDLWDAIKTLEGVFITPDSGLEYLPLVDGFLGGAWRKMTPDGVFLVWPFGYIEGLVQTPKLALIFKNNKVHELVPHAPREELERYFK